MNRYLFAGLLAFVMALCSQGVAFGKGGGGSSGSSSGSKSVHVQGYTRSDGTYVAPHYRSSPGTGGGGSFGSTQGAPAPYVGASSRDENGHINRDPNARSAFQHQNPCPSTGKTSGACPGYVVDHVTPLKRGGADAPSNMQWQTESAAKLKDKYE